MEQFKSLLTPIFLKRNDLLNSLRKRAWEKAWQLSLPESFKKVSLSPLYEISEDEFTNIESDGPVQHTLDAALKNYGTFLQSRILRNIQTDTNPFLLLTEALSNNGLFFYIPPKTKVSRPIHLFYNTPDKVLSFPKIQIIIGNDSEATFVCNHDHSISFSLLDVVVEANAKCRILELSHAGSQMHHVRATVKRNASFTHLCQAGNSSLFRQDLSVELVEEGAECNLKGFWELANEERSHTQVLVTHKAPHTRSNQHYKGVVREKSLSTFEGKIYVHPEAQKTEAYQLNNNLILDAGAKAYTKPNLEIFADDVKASHGATIAEVNEEELFYLQARGMPKLLAMNALVRGFTHAIRKEFANV